MKTLSWKVINRISMKLLSLVHMLVMHRRFFNVSITINDTKSFRLLVQVSLSFVRSFTPTVFVRLSGYKTVQVLEEYADYYLHMTAIKKWDLCAPDAVLRANHGTMTTLTNQTISYDHQKNEMLVTDGLLATYKRNHNELLTFLVDSNLTKHVSQKKN
jgi:fructose-1,6-bisphosphatase/inositol monophosphatase family enzyme